MTQTPMADVTSFSHQLSPKQLKKQGKRERKLVRKIQKAQRNVQKAEMRMNRARLSQEMANSRLRTFEDELNKMRGGNSGNQSQY